MHTMPGFLAALHAARAQRPDLPRAVWRAVANTERREFARLRVNATMVRGWAEFYALTARVA